MRFTTKCLFLGSAALTLAAFSGCSHDTTAADVAAKNTSNIQRVTNLYNGFQYQHGWKGPANEAEFKEFIKAYAPDKLKMMGVDAGNVDAIFTSDRDGKPFKIRYGVAGGPNAVVPITFEEAGQNGKKQVGFTSEKLEEVDEARYALLWSGKGGTAPSAGPSAGPPAGGGPAAGAGRPSGRPAGAPTGPPGG